MHEVAMSVVDLAQEEIRLGPTVKDAQPRSESLRDGRPGRTSILHRKVLSEYEELVAKSISQ
jgi:hypothetical protein